MHHNIVLIGLMGSGKSTIGKKLAARHALTFVDTDTMIEKTTQQRISEIFEIHGESHFRDLETACCHQLKNKQNHVIATGGGIILRKENRDLLRETGFVVYLSASIETLLKRLKTDTKRPLLQHTDKHARLTSLHAERDPLYTATAHIRISTALPPRVLIEKIWQAYQKSR